MAEFFKRGAASKKTYKNRRELAETNHYAGLLPFVALCLFAGIRPDLYNGEISELDAEDVRLNTGVILIEPEGSKVRMKRAVTIQPKLAAWLRTYTLDVFPIKLRGSKRLHLKSGRSSTSPTTSSATPSSACTWRSTAQMGDAAL